MIRTFIKETLLAEKFQTVLSRDIANTRMRDFYDIYFLSKEKQEEIQEGTLLRKAFLATCKKRATIFTKEVAIQICERILHDKAMEERWEAFGLDNYFVGEIEWTAIMKQVSEVMANIVFPDIMSVVDVKSDPLVITEKKRWK